MNNFKKHPIFTAIFALLLAAFVGGMSYNAVLIGQNSKAEAQIKAAQRRFESAVAQDPGKANLELADKNLNSLVVRLDLLDKYLSNKSSVILRPSPYKQGYELQEYMRSTVQKWANNAAEKGIQLPNKFDFSFKKYTEDNAKPMGDETVNALWKQFNILEYIVNKLYESKPKDSSMRVLSIQREFLPEEKEAAAAAAANSRTRRGKISNDADTFEVDKFITARKEGSISALAYKISFTGYTETMRRFLNSLNSYDLMLVVRSVEVKPYVETASVVSTKKAASDEFSDLLSDDEKPAEKVIEATREPVVSENLSEFTFVIEYIEVDKTMPEPVKAAEVKEEE